MVKILNGEIVQDDDPRLQQHHARPAAASRPSAGRQGRPTAAAGGFSSGFDFSAPAVKLVPRGSGGIPDVELFALRVPGVGLLGVAAAGAFFGLRGLLAAAVLGYLYVRTGGGGAAAGTPTAAGQRAGGGGGGMFMQQQQQQPDDDGFTGGLQQRPTNGPSGSVFRGKGHKLGAS